MLILDTNVVSALRRPDRHARVVTWLQAQTERDLFISIVTLGEIERGARLRQRRDPAFARALDAWLEDTIGLFADRLIDFGRAEARVWGRLSAELGHTGADLMIAATALAHGARVATRNVGHFRPAGVDVVDPFVA